VWLVAADARYQKKPWPHGVIYVQPISSGYTKAYKSCFKLLELACGPRATENISIVFTKGDGDTESARKVEEYKDTKFDKYKDRVILKADNKSQSAAAECINLL